MYAEELSQAEEIIYSLVPYLLIVLICITLIPAEFIYLFINVFIISI